MSARPITDQRRRDRHQLVAAVRSLPAIPAREDQVLAVGILHPHALSAPERKLAAAWERRSDEAIAHIRAEHEQLRDTMRRTGR
jgi:hypothetical protein